MSCCNFLSQANLSNQRLTHRVTFSFVARWFCATAVTFHMTTDRFVLWVGRNVTHDSTNRRYLTWQIETPRTYIHRTAFASDWSMASGKTGSDRFGRSPVWTNWLLLKRSRWKYRIGSRTWYYYTCSILICMDDPRKYVNNP